MGGGGGGGRGEDRAFHYHCSNILEVSKGGCGIRPRTPLPSVREVQKKKKALNSEKEDYRKGNAIYFWLPQTIF